MRRIFLFYLLSISVASVTLTCAQSNEIKGGRYQHREFYFDKGKDALEAENFENAIEHFTQALKYDAYHADSYFLRAMAKENLGDKDGALTDYNIILHMSPEFVEALFGRGLLYYSMGKYGFAERDFVLLLQTPVTETSSIFFKFSNYESGTIGVLTMEAKEAEVHNYLGLIRTKLRKYETALKDFNKAITLNATDPNFYVNRGLVREEKREVELAKLDYQKALDIDPGNNLATYNLLRLSDGGESESVYSDLIEENPEFAEPYAQRGLSRYNSGDYRGALEDYNKAISINNQDHELFLNRGMIKEKLRDLAGAFKDYTSSVDLKPDYGKGFLNRGNVSVKRRDYAKAIEDYDMAISINPVNASTFYNRGVAKYSLQDAESACNDVTRALELGMESAQKAAETMCRNID
ncbi:MAG: tetratricopeptide repeat protein [Cyclobacteriaceae bacterium]